MRAYVFWYSTLLCRKFFVANCSLNKRFIVLRPGNQDKTNQLINWMWTWMTMNLAKYSSFGNIYMFLWVCLLDIYPQSATYMQCSQSNFCFNWRCWNILCCPLFCFSFFQSQSNLHVKQNLHSFLLGRLHILPIPFHLRWKPHKLRWSFWYCSFNLFEPLHIFYLVWMQILKG